MKILILSLLSLVLCMACTTKTIAPESLKQDLLFPFGVYEHKITLMSSNTAINGRAFKGVVSLSASKIDIVALSFFGTTVFKISENLLTNEVAIEIYVEQMKKIEPKLRQYYQLLRAFLTAPKSGVWDKRLEVVERFENNKPKRIEVADKTADKTIHSEFTILSYDKNEIPEKVTSTDKDVEVTVHISGYELRP